MDTIIMGFLKRGLWLVVILGLLLGSSIGAAESRVALVIGNSEYQNFPHLFSPVVDARAFRAELEQRGFTVVYKENATRKEMNRAMGDFIELLSSNAVAVVYYSGHGVEINGANYFLPIDLAVEAGLTQVQSERAVIEDALGLQRLMSEMSSKEAKFKLLIVDACRDNPFAVHVKKGVLGQTIGKPKGLTIETTNANGLMVVYAAGSHQAAWDGEAQKNSLFTQEFLQAMQQPGLTVQQLVYVTKNKVIKESTRLGSAQTPAVYDQSTGEFVFTAGAPVPMPSERLADIERQNREAEARLNAKQAELDAIEQRRLVAEERARVAEAEAARNAAAEQQKIAAEQARLAARNAERKEFEPEMVQITGGTFMMGSPEGEGSSDEHPQHEVTVGDFAIGKYEVTQGEWQAVMGNNPARFPSCGERCPVERVSWHDVQEYIAKLNAKTGKTYRLPTEAEWEYACRGGAVGETYCGGNDIDSVAWYYDNSARTTHPVGQKAANGFGLFDMSGNVWEWTCSNYGSYGNSGKETTCANKGNSVARAVRGGSWYTVPSGVRAAYRNFDTPSHRFNGHLGFRAVQD